MPFDKKAYDKEYWKKYQEKNKDKLLKKWRDYREENKDRLNANDRARVKSNRIKVWKKIGILCDDEWEEVYDWYSNTTNCDICDKLFVKSIDKCLDHDHHLEGYNVRSILCRKCNCHFNEI